MKYTFEIEETLTRRVAIEGDTLDEALREFYTQFENQEIVLTADDFAGAQLSLIPEKSWVCDVERDGEPIDKEGIAIVIDYWQYWE